MEGCCSCTDGDCACAGLASTAIDTAPQKAPIRSMRLPHWLDEIPRLQPGQDRKADALTILPCVWHLGDTPICSPHHTDHSFRYRRQYSNHTTVDRSLMTEESGPTKHRHLVENGRSSSADSVCGPLVRIRHAHRRGSAVDSYDAFAAARRRRLQGGFQKAGGSRSRSGKPSDGFRHVWRFRCPSRSAACITRRVIRCRPPHGEIPDMLVVRASEALCNLSAAVDRQELERPGALL